MKRMIQHLLERDQIFGTYSAQNVHKCLVCMTVKWWDQTKQQNISVG